MFFEMLRACVDDLLHAEHFGTEEVFDIVNVPVSLIYTPVRIRKPHIDCPCKIVQPLIIHQYADQHGKRGESRCSKRRHQLIRSNHSFISISTLKMFFEMLQACVDDLLHAEHFAAQ